ncbi:arsenical pump-driving ATPase [Macrococcoides bohemicum]|uniref:arsenical pump-driving ATPase n=1 Tax=Macrococcoides bohemicum TaxID=1903056 RepID=UPI001C5E3562|nr:arsenical pump-driving ATPase [Macrococcus bohemicus]QYA45159.1 arsenical pump-driving ATPase [Macrococcus bohemicus]
MQKFNPDTIPLTKYLFFTGKGGVGKTSISSALAVHLSEQGRRVALVSTDPASNLQDIFEMDLTSELTQVPSLQNLYVANFEPVEAAEKYKQSVIQPYIGVLPEFAIKNMEEQLSGSCTVEVAAFNEFTGFLANKDYAQQFDHIIFDTAPTGHTLRMLELPDAWYSFIESSTHEASCLGQLSGLSDNKQIYLDAVNKLRDVSLTTMMFVARGDQHSIQELMRAMDELRNLDITNDMVIINGIIENPKSELAIQKVNKEQMVLGQFEDFLKQVPNYYVPMKQFNIYGIEAMKHMFSDDITLTNHENVVLDEGHTIEELVDKMIEDNKRYIFTMGKGGVGKTTIAKIIAKRLAAHGKSVLLATTDPANIWYDTNSNEQVTVKYIDEAKALKDYEAEVLSAANHLSQDQIDYIKEDLRSPCTQEIAFFRAFSDFIADKAHDVVVIDTAPTGHTLLLLDASQSYHKEVERNTNVLPSSVSALLPSITNNDLTEMVIVTLAEPTPIKEAERLQADLKRTGINQRMWVVNNTIATQADTHDMFNSKIQEERKQINKLIAHQPFVAIQPYDVNIEEVSAL